MKVFLNSLFGLPPESWGARGDPYLWKELAIYFRATELPSDWVSVQILLDEAFLELCGKPTSTEDWFHIEKYSHGGMSSGYVEPSCWRDGGKISNHLKRQFQTL